MSLSLILNDARSRIIIKLIKNLDCLQLLIAINRSGSLFRSFLRAETVNETLSSNLMIISTVSLTSLFCAFSSHSEARKENIMDVNAQKTKIPSRGKLGDRLQKVSSLLSVAAILMTVSLFVRTETNSKMLDSKFMLKIQEMGNALESVRAACQVLRKDSDLFKSRSFRREFS